MIPLMAKDIPDNWRVKIRYSDNMIIRIYNIILSKKSGLNVM